MHRAVVSGSWQIFQYNLSIWMMCFSIFSTEPVMFRRTKVLARSIVLERQSLLYYCQSELITYYKVERFGSKVSFKWAPEMRDCSWNSQCVVLCLCPGLWPGFDKLTEGVKRSCHSQKLPDAVRLSAFATGISVSRTPWKIGIDLYTREIFPYICKAA